uniref:C-type lectin domain-containing protein n=1 Tax=Sphaeramia orbicularis TaxID=375764 RepID=A0A673BEK7_9TELE
MGHNSEFDPSHSFTHTEVEVHFFFFFSAARNSCPRGWHSLDSRCFLFVSRPSSWYNAEEHCIILGGRLASVSSTREYNFLQLITGSQYSHAWLGGFSLQVGWLWADGEGFYYDNWDSRYSTSAYPSSSYPCMFLQTHYGWGRSTCRSPRPFICSKSAFSC